MRVGAVLPRLPRLNAIEPRPCTGVPRRTIRARRLVAISDRGAEATDPETAWRDQRNIRALPTVGWGRERRGILRLRSCIRHAAPVAPVSDDATESPRAEVLPSRARLPPLAWASPAAATRWLAEPPAALPSARRSASVRVQVRGGLPARAPRRKRRRDFPTWAPGSAKTTPTMQRPGLYSSPMTA